MNIIKLDLTMQILRLFIMLAFLSYVLYVKKKGKVLEGWGYILIGFVLLIFAMLTDLIIDFPQMAKFIIFGKTVYQAFILRLVEDFLGLLFVLIGFLEAFISLQVNKKPLDEVKKFLKEKKVAFEMTKAKAFETQERDFEWRDANRKVLQEFYS